MQRAMYDFGFPRIMDLTRARWTDDARPLPIAPEIQEVLKRDLGHE
jgi:hypothetical protein